MGSALAYCYLMFAGLTTRIKRIKSPEFEALETKTNYIYAIWHARQAFLAYAHRHTNICALVSRSKDGEYMARLIQKLGIGAVRGSTSKGGSLALLALIDEAQAGRHPVITPDGPRGPQRTVQQGIIFLAQKTGLPIIPATCGISSKIVFHSWDRFELPLPFGRAVVIYGRPITVSETDDTAAKADEIQTELNRITDIADGMIA